MEEKKDPFVEALNNNDNSSEHTQKEYVVSKFEVNPGAEKVLSTMAIIILVVGCFVAFFFIIYGLTEYETRNGGLILFTSIILGTLVALIYIIQWAMLRVFVNMSRNLFIVNEQLKKIQKSIDKNKRI